MPTTAGRQSDELPHAPEKRPSAAAVRALGTPDPDLEASLQRLTTLTTSLLRAPAAQVVLWDDGAPVSVAATGMDRLGSGGNGGVSAAFLRELLDAEELVLVGDTATLPENPLGPGVRSWAGAPVRSADGHVVGTLRVLDTQPRRWSTDDEQVLVALAHAASAAVALHAASRREVDARARADFHASLLRATHEATLDGVLVVSPEGRILSWNQRFAKVWPIDDEAMASGQDDAALASVLRRVVDPEGFVERVRDLYARAALARDEVQLRDGRVLDRYGTPLFGEDGTHHGYAWFVRDVSAERAAVRSLEASEQRYRSLVSALTNEVWSASPAGDLLTDLPGWRAVTGQTPAELLGRGWLDGVHPADRARAADAWREAVAHRTPYEVEYRIGPVSRAGDIRGEAELDAAARTLELRGVPIVRDGEVTEWVGVYVDVTEMRAADAAERRLVAVAAAAAESTRALQDVTAALSGAATTADVTAVILDKGRAVLGASGSGVALRDGDRVHYEVLTGYSADIKSTWSDFAMDEDTPVTRAIRTGRPSFMSTQDDLLSAFPDNPRLRGFIDASGEKAFARLPLLTSSAVIGALVFGFDTERTFSEDARHFMLALAGQCAQAIERAQLYERERNTARLLQRSLLPEALPLVAGVQLSALCQSAANVEVGGDWYDALVLDDGRVVLVVGDVRGKGVRAASVLGQVRNALRGLLHADPDPAKILGWLDSVVGQLGDDEEFVTLVYAVADPRTGQVQWACAGHMPPLLLGGVGAGYLPVTGDLPLGLAGDRRRAHLVLEPGQALMLFSDGLVENRRRPLGQGLDQLLRHATQMCAGAVPSAQTLRDGLTAAMVDPSDTDDVTVLVLRRSDLAHAQGGKAFAADLALPARPTSPAAARRFVTGRLRDWKALGVLDPVLLCLSELVTNAVVHAQSPVRLSLRCGEGVVRVDVRDVGNPVLAPIRRVATTEDTHGRGLVLIDSFADRWGVLEEAEGKVIWFEVTLG